MAPSIEIVVAIAQNGVIGAKGGLPWRLPSDLKRFKALTMGKPVIMGRKTHESIGRPLPGRRNIVVTANASAPLPGVERAASLDEALELAFAGQDAAQGVCVIGGGRIYEQALDRADLLHVTHVLEEVEGDTFFPQIDPHDWEPVSREEIPRTPQDSAAMLLVTYERRKESAKAAKSAG
jgi:dihydrofolate reductase